MLVHLIAEVIKSSEELDLFEATRIALNEVVGAYAIAVVDITRPDELILARKSSPLVIGIGEGEYFVASDATPIIEYTKNVVYLEDEEVARVSLSAGLKIRTIRNHKVTPVVTELEMALESIEKGVRAFHAQGDPRATPVHCRLPAWPPPTRARHHPHGRHRRPRSHVVHAKRLIIVACGTSWHAGLVAEYMFEDFVRIPVEVEYASEFRYRNPVLEEGDILIAISQSGETADTLAAIRMAKERGAHVFGICNVVGSSISRESDSGAYTHAGPEIGVASTKAFTAQLTVLALVAMRVGQLRGTIDPQQLNRLMVGLDGIPEKVEALLKKENAFKAIAEAYKGRAQCLVPRPRIQFPSRPRGCPQAQGNQLHPRGRLSCRRNEARPHCPDRREHAGLHRCHPGCTLRKGALQHPGGESPRRQIIAVVTAGDTEVARIADHVIEVHPVRRRPCAHAQHRSRSNS